MVNAVATFLDAHVEAGRAGTIAVVTPHETLSYEDLHALTCRAGAALRRLGVEPEQRVALLLHDSPAFAAAFFAAIRIGAVAVPLNTRMTPEQAIAILADSRAKVLVADRRLLEPLRAGLAALRHRCEIVATRPDGLLDWPAADTAEALSPESVDEDAMAFWLYTSGTTGMPKAVVHLHRNMLVWHHYGRDVLGIGAGDRVFATSRLSFSYALGNAFLIPLASGATVYLHPAWPEPAGVAALLRSFRPTVFFSVPTFYSRLLRAELPADAFRSLRYGVSAGERLPPEIQRAFRQCFGLEIVDAMGTSETLFMLLSNYPGRSWPGSSGVPIPGTDAKLLDGEGREVPPGAEGVLHVRSPSTCACYWNRVERSRRTFCGEWFRTGDVYRRDAEGYYYHCGREDDFFKVAGQWVSPFEVERVLAEHPGVAEAGVVGVAETQGLVKAVAFVVPREAGAPASALIEELRRLADETLPTHQRPRAFRLVSALPRTASGKLQRFRLKDLTAA